MADWPAAADEIDLIGVLAGVIALVLQGCIGPAAVAATVTAKPCQDRQGPRPHWPASAGVAEKVCLFALLRLMRACFAKMGVCEESQRLRTLSARNSRQTTYLYHWSRGQNPVYCSVQSLRWSPGTDPDYPG